MCTLFIQCHSYNYYTRYNLKYSVVLLVSQTILCCTLCSFNVVHIAGLVTNVHSLTCHGPVIQIFFYLVLALGTTPLIFQLNIMFITKYLHLIEKWDLTSFYKSFIVNLHYDFLIMLYSITFCEGSFSQERVVDSWVINSTINHHMRSFVVRARSRTSVFV